MLGDLLGGLMGGMDKESITKDTIQDTLEKIAIELNKPFSDFFIMIKSVDAEFNFRCDIFQYIDKKPVHVREITVAEIVGKEK